MKYLSLLLIVSFLSCDKDNDQSLPKTNLPTVTSISITTENVSGVNRPKFTISLNIPDTAAVGMFMLHVYPNGAASLFINKPKTGTYTLIDNTNTHPAPADKKTYVSAFIMTDNSAVSNPTFEIN